MTLDALRKLESDLASDSSLSTLFEKRDPAYIAALLDGRVITGNQCQAQILQWDLHELLSHCSIENQGDWLAKALQAGAARCFERLIAPGSCYFDLYKRAITEMLQSLESFVTIYRTIGGDPERTILPLMVVMQAAMQKQYPIQEANTLSGIVTPSLESIHITVLDVLSGLNLAMYKASGDDAVQLENSFHAVAANSPLVKLNGLFNIIENLRRKMLAIEQ